jgi:hypothetical protein
LIITKFLSPMSGEEERPKREVPHPLGLPTRVLEIDRDLNASLNIVTLGLRGRAYRDAAKAGQ